MKRLQIVLFSLMLLLAACADEPLDLAEVKDPTLSQRPADITLRCQVYQAVLDFEGVPRHSESVRGPASPCMLIDRYDLFVETLNRPAPPKKEVLSVTLSEIDFNQDYTIANLGGTLVCGPLCGYGRDYTLVKKDGAWVVTQAEKTVVF
jgi:hypothetical protein